MTPKYAPGKFPIDTANRVLVSTRLGGVAAWQLPGDAEAYVWWERPGLERGWYEVHALSEWRFKNST